MPYVILLAQENVGGLIRAPGEGGAEATIINAVQCLNLIVETTGAVII